MIAADFVAIGVILLFTVIGVISGFGKGLKFFTGGIFGKIISVVACYFLFGIVLDWGFVQDLMLRFVNFLTEKDNFFCFILLKVRIDLIGLLVALFFVVLLLKRLVIFLVCKFFEIDNRFMNVLNKFLGAVLYLLAMIVLVLLIFQLISIIGGKLEANLLAHLSESIFGLDKLYLDNPLLSIIKSIKL